MDKVFSIDDEIEQVLLLIEEDNSLIKKLSVGELEILNRYLNQKKDYLVESEGE